MDETARCGNCDGDDEAHIRNIHLSRNFKYNRKHQNCCSTVRNQFCKYICDDIDDEYDAKNPKRTRKSELFSAMNWASPDWVIAAPIPKALAINNMTSNCIYVNISDQLISLVMVNKITAISMASNIDSIPSVTDRIITSSSPKASMPFKLLCLKVSGGFTVETT